MRSVAVPLVTMGFLALAVAVYLGLAIGRLDTSLNGLRRDLFGVPSRIINVMDQPTCTTLTKTIGETTHTQSYYQDPGETDEAYLQRVRDAWAAYCEGL